MAALCGTFTTLGAASLSSTSSVNVRGSSGFSLRLSPSRQLCVSSRSVRRAAVVSELSEFAHQEAKKFREGLLRMLADNPDATADEKLKIADVCTPIFGEFANEYSGTFSPEPFGRMKEALDSHQLPASVAAMCAAVGWSRYNLYHDWITAQERK